MRKEPVTHVSTKPTAVSSVPTDAEEDSLGDPFEEPITVRPDGYYWRVPEGKQEFGPFESLELAQADRESADEEAPEPGETLQEAQDEIGMADWIDPETGEPAEGQSPPRLEEE